MPEETRHCPILIVGGGTGGITVAARLRRARPDLEITILEPSDRHFYQPMWTLVGAGVKPKETTLRPEASVIPPGVQWIRDAAEEVLPEERRLRTRDGLVLEWDRLVLAPGIQLNWDAIPGLAGNVGRNGLCSNYSYETVDSTWKAIREFQGGRAIFTHPSTPIKCGGAPQKILYLASDFWRRHKPPGDYQATFCIASPSIFGVAWYAEPLMKVVERYGIELRTEHDLVAVDAGARRATFRCLDSGEEVELEYGMMHVTPPMSAPDFLRRSPVANAEGWIEVDPKTLQHVRYPEVFALGDASSLPTSKTGAAIRKQAPVLVENLLASLDGRPLEAAYDGYTSCPLVTAYGKVILAEFDYDGNPQETFPFDQRKERRSMYLLKKYVLPVLYWKGMLRGRA